MQSGRSAAPVVAIVGATGAVGIELLGCLERRNFPMSELRLFASARSAGKTLPFGGKPLPVRELTEEGLSGVNIGLFSAGSSTSKRFAPVAVSKGAVVVDNSSAFRMAAGVPLVVPEINRGSVREHKGIIANPNCTVAAFTVPLAPLHKAATLKRVIACSYQSVSGAGQQGVEQLWSELEATVASHRPLDRPQGRAFAHPIALNLIPAVGSWRESGFSEETKVAEELRKMLDAPSLPVGVTCVRVPTVVAHGVAVHAEFDRPLSVSRARALLADAPGVELVDEPAAGRYPTPLAAAGRDPCFVGRLRLDEAGGLAFFVVADNLRKGAALNAVQIAERLIEMGLLTSKVTS